MTQLLKTTSLLAIAAVAGALATSAQAADLGGNCCTDLEERVAELEATTARKGNRKVSLQIYGQVSETLMWWNDGKESNTYVQENNAVKNILGFTGNAKVTSDFTAGFKLEVQIRANRSSAANQLAFGENNGVTITTYNTQSVSLREANWYIESQTYGRITMGKVADATVGTSGINLANPDGFQAAGGFMGFANQGFFIRAKNPTGFTSNTTGALGGNLSGLTLANFGYARNGDGPAAFDYAQTASQVKYTSPFFLGHTKSSGFQFSSSWGQDEMWAVALRYAEEFGPMRLAAGFGYLDSRGLDRNQCTNATGNGTGAPNPGAGNGSSVVTAAGALQSQTQLSNGVSNVDCHMWQASASVMHTPTGLYVSGGGAMITDNNRQLGLNLAQESANGQVLNGLTRVSAADKSDGFWWIQAGWEAKLNPLGKTTFYGTYAKYNIGTGVANEGVQTLSGTDPLNSIGKTAFLASNELHQWGLGVTQSVDAAAMNLFLGYINTQQSGVLGDLKTGVLLKSNASETNQVLYTGATIKF